MPKTFAPDSVADATISGVCASLSTVDRNPRTAAAAAAAANLAFSAGCRNATGAWSRIVGSEAVTTGR